MTTINKGHSRRETRPLTYTSGNCAYLAGAGATHLIRRACERHILRMTCTMAYGFTHLPPRETSAVLRKTLRRGHETIESASHDIRDVTLCEERNSMYTRQEPEAHTALRNSLLAHRRRASRTNSAYNTGHCRLGHGWARADQRPPTLTLP